MVVVVVLLLLLLLLLLPVVLLLPVPVRVLVVGFEIDISCSRSCATDLCRVSLHIIQVIATHDLRAALVLTNFGRHSRAEGALVRTDLLVRSTRPFPLPQHPRRAVKIHRRQCSDTQTDHDG